MQPLISVITISYNAAPVIEATLRSVASQTFGDYEHLIIDGASTDDTLRLVALAGNPRIEVHSRKDSGIYHAMNRGLKYAIGKYVIFLNAGDRFAAPDTLARYAEAALQDPDIIYGDTMIVDEQGTILRPRHLSAPDVLTRKSFLDGMLICHQAFMVKRAIAPSYSREFALSADYDWCLRCIEASGLAKRRNLRTVTVHYLDNGISEKKKFKSLRERFVIMKRHYGLIATVKAHLRFVPRALKRKIRPQ